MTDHLFDDLCLVGGASKGLLVAKDGTALQYVWKFMRESELHIPDRSPWWELAFHLRSRTFHATAWRGTNGMNLAEEYAMELRALLPDKEIAKALSASITREG